MFESLESRRLFSAPTTIADAARVHLHGQGELQIQGQHAHNNLVVIETGGVVEIHDLVNDQWSSYDGVQSIKINGGSGNDTIVFRGSSIGADITTGNGNDSITFLDAGNASSNVDSGNGNDNIVVVYSHAAIVRAGSGIDVININTGNYGSGYDLYDYSDTDITVDAGAGNDILYIHAGHGTLSGASSKEDTFADLSNGLATFSLKKIESIFTV